MTLQEAIEQLKKSPERKNEDHIEYSIQSASVVLEIMSQYANKEINEQLKIAFKSDMWSYLSAFSSFVCLDRVFRYNYGFFQVRMEDFWSYLYSLCKRLDTIVKHYNTLAEKCKCLSEIVLVYDESYIFSLKKEEKMPCLSLNRQQFVKLNKKEDDKYSLAILGLEEQIVVASFEIRSEEMLNEDSIENLCNKLNCII